MSPRLLTPEDVATLTALANGILPADDRDAGAAAVNAGPTIAERIRQGAFASVYLAGLSTADELARETFARTVSELNASQLSELIALLRERSPAFFRQLRADVCARYLGDLEVSRRIGFPGPSAERGGYPDFDRPLGNLGKANRPQ